MDLKFLFYVFLSIVLITGGTYNLYSSRLQTTAMLFFFGSIAAAVVFGLRWFSPSGNVLGKTAGAWPPVINYCPDFLSLYVVNGEQVCIDTIGIAQTGGITKWTDPTQTDEKYLFRLSLNMSGKARTDALCQQCQAKKVTWEGVWDGTSCSGVNPPMPPAAAQAP